MLKFRTLAFLSLVPMAACSGAATDDGGDGGNNSGSGGTSGVAGVQQGGANQGGTAQGGSTQGGAPAGGNPTGGTGPSGGVSGTAGTAGTPSGGASGAGPTGGASGAAATGGTAGSPAGGGGTGGTPSGGTGGSSAGTAGAAGMPVNCPAAPTGLIGWATQGGMTTGGGNASPTTITSGSASQLTDSTARVLQFTTLSGTVEVGSNKTLQGMGATATINGKISIEGRSNIILRNFRLNASSSEDDGISIQDSNHIWIDHLEIYDAEDGNMDITDGSDYITVSWTKFRYSSTGDHNFSNLIGSDDSDSGNYRITFHHNWWANNVLERMPRVRFGQVHVFNNLYGVGSGAAANDHCIRAAHEADVRVESNYFDIVRTPYEIAEDGGTAVMSATKCANDTSVGSPAGCNIEHLSLNTGGNPTSRGTAFTPPYQSMMTPADCVKAHVSNAQTGAGPH